MTTLRQAMLDLVDDLPEAAGSSETGLRVAVSAVELALPVEGRIGRGAEFLVDLPRGRIATGFDIPVSRISARFEVEGDGGQP